MWWHLSVEIANSITTLVFNFILLALSGNNAVAAYGVIANIALVGTAIFNGVSQGLQPLASTSYGKGDKEDVKKILRQSLVIAVILSIVLVSAVWVFAQGLVGIFNSAQSAELAKGCRAGTPDLFLRVLSGGGQYCAGGIFQCDRTGTCIFPDRGIAWNHCDQPDGIHAVEAFWCNWCLDGISGYRGRDIWYCDGNSGCE